MHDFSLCQKDNDNERQIITSPKYNFDLEEPEECLDTFQEKDEVEIGNFKDNSTTQHPSDREYGSHNKIVNQSYNMRNSELDQTDQKLANLSFNYGNGVADKVGSNKSVIIDVLEDPELGKNQEVEERIPLEVTRKY